MIITITGKPGSGKSTIAKRLAEKLQFKHYDMGALQRQMARERGLTLEEWQGVNEKDASIDQKLDAYQKDLGKKEDNVVLEGRMSHVMIPHAVKIYLDVDLHEAAHRIFLEKRNSHHNEKAYASEESLYEAIVARMKSEDMRWEKTYGVTMPHDPSKFDLFLDTTTLSIDEVFEKVYTFVQSR